MIQTSEENVVEKLGKTKYETLDWLIKEPLHFSKALVDNADADWDPESLDKGIAALDRFQHRTDDWRMRNTQEHYKVPEAASILRHLSLAVYGPIHLLSGDCLDNIAKINLPDSKTEGDVSVKDSLADIVKVIRPKVVDFAKYFIDEAREYGFRFEADSKPYHLIGVDQKIIDTLNDEKPFEVDLPKDKVDNQFYMKSARRINKLLDDVSTRAYSYFTNETNYGGAGGVRLDPQTVMSDKGLHTHEVHRRLREIRPLNMAKKLEQIREDYDNAIESSTREDESGQKFRLGIEAARVQMEYIAELHHLYTRHMFRDKHPAAKEMLRKNLYEGDSKQGLKHSISLAGYSAAHILINAENHLNFSVRGI